VTPSTVPWQNPEQRQAALALANETRTYRAGVKRSLKLIEPDLSRKLVAEHVMDPPQRMVTMKVSELLLATPTLGPKKAHKMLRRAEVPPSKTLGTLTQRQRLSLRAELL